LNFSRGRIVGAKQTVIKPPPLLPPPSPSLDIGEALACASGPISGTPPAYDWKKVDSIPGWFDREEADWLAFAVAHCGVNGRFVEVGSFCGRSSFVIASSMGAGGFLWCIDPWLYPDIRSGILFTPGQFQAVHESDTPKVVFDKNMQAFKNHYRAIVGMSPEAGKDVPDRLEFVFLDGGHDEFSVSRDLLLWWGKLRRGGILCGHDYGNSAFPGVVQAVDRFSATTGVDIWRGGGLMFYMVKP